MYWYYFFITVVQLISHCCVFYISFYKVLTSHSCSEEGLEDAANILLQLSRGDGATRDTVLRLLLSGARHLGYTLCKQIGQCWLTTQMPVITLLFKHRQYSLHRCFNISSLSGTLLAELREYNLEQQRRAQTDTHSPDGPPEDSSISARPKGKMTSRLASDGCGPLCDIRLSVHLKERQIGLVTC